MSSQGLLMKCTEINDLMKCGIFNVTVELTNTFDTEYHCAVKVLDRRDKTSLISDVHV